MKLKSLDRLGTTGRFCLSLVLLAFFALGSLAVYADGNRHHNSAAAAQTPTPTPVPSVTPGGPTGPTGPTDPVPSPTGSPSPMPSPTMKPM